MLKKMGNVFVCPERMHRSGTNRDGHSREQLANPLSPGRRAIEGSLLIGFTWSDDC